MYFNSNENRVSAWMGNLMDENLVILERRIFKVGGGREYGVNIGNT